MKKTYYSLRIKQKTGENDTITIEYGNLKNIRYKYSKRKGFFKATLKGFSSERYTIEYTDIVAVIKERWRR